jgi:hypothetical protein
MRKIVSSLLLLASLAAAASASPLSSGDFNNLKKEAQRAAQAGDMSGLAGKLHDLGGDDSERAVKFIAELGVRVPDMSVYEAARDALAGMRSDEATDALIAIAEKDRNPMVQILAVDAIGARDDDRSVLGLSKALADRQDEVVRAAIAAVKKRKAVQAVDALIDVVARLETGKESDGLTITQAREALAAITGQSYAKAVDWRNFWEPRKASFRPVTGDAPVEVHGTSERAHPHFFGSEIRSNRLVFVIDTSGSMEAADPLPANGDPTPGGSRVRMERAKQQLAAVIDALPEDCRFTIVSYSGALFQGPGGGVQLPPGTPEDGPLPPTIGGFEWLKVFKPRLFPANRQTKAEAKDWVSKLQANGSTFTYNALAQAFQVEGADTIVLLSDGVPTEYDRKNKTEMTTDKILEGVRMLNRFRRLRIDTFGFDPDGEAPDPSGGAGGGSRTGFGRHGGGGGGGGGSLGQFMQDLASENGGTYTQIR